MEPDNIMVRVLKYDGTEYRRWNARLTRRAGSLVVLDAEFETDVSHHLLGEIKRGTRTVEYYWLDRWYNIFRFLSEDGETRLYYCNINTLPSLENGVLTYIDLDIDLLVQPDSSYRVLDLEEFDDNAIHYGYSDQVKAEAQAAVSELISLIENHEFPFLLEYSSLSSVIRIR
jgi:protein associated with RNAse G/E